MWADSPTNVAELQHRFHNLLFHDVIFTYEQARTSLFETSGAWGLRIHVCARAMFIGKPARSYRVESLSTDKSLLCFAVIPLLRRDCGLAVIWAECALQRQLVGSWEEHASIPLCHPSIRVGAQRCISGTQSHGHLREIEKEQERPVPSLQSTCVPILQRAIEPRSAT